MTWTSESSKLQPITQYRVSVRTENLDDSKSVDIRSRRQSDVELKEYITPEERLLLEDVEGGKTYTIQVCAENDLGHACALPAVVSIKVGDGPKTLVLISDGLGDAEPTTVASTLPQGYVIIIILLPCILFLAVCILVISVIICSCSRYNSKNYYPSQQGKV
ncbi:MAG: fibronectin type III domain-containing protein [Proteobacteria bacterium]|nr:fibronectin type III domain-containing protein [Pseudomonadota bacterium]